MNSSIHPSIYQSTHPSIHQCTCGSSVSTASFTRGSHTRTHPATHVLRVSKHTCCATTRTQTVLIPLFKLAGCFTYVLVRYGRACMLQTHTYVKQVTNRLGLQLAIRTRRSLIQRDSKCAINMHVGLLLKTIHHQHAQAHNTYTHELADT